MKVYFERPRYHIPIGFSAGIKFFIGFAIAPKIYKKWFRIRFGISYTVEKEYKMFCIYLFFWEILFFTKKEQNNA